MISVNANHSKINCGDRIYAGKLFVSCLVYFAQLVCGEAEIIVAEHV